jgi:hypothetical protein
MQRTSAVTTFGEVTDICKKDNIRDHPTTWHVGHRRLLPLLPFSPYLTVSPPPVMELRTLHILMGYEL